MEIYQQSKSSFHIYRENYQPKHPKILDQLHLSPNYNAAEISEEISKIFPNTQKRGVKSVTFSKGQNSQAIVNALRIGCVLSGGQAAGGHNVIVGIYEYIKKRHQSSQLFGFLNGPKGIFTGKYKQLTQDHINYFKNRGGFDMICSGRDKIQTQQQKQKSLKYCESLKLDGLVVIGGDDSNTNAALLAQYFLQKGSNIKVVGCPKTIDGDLKNEFVQVSFGFDTACKTYSECIGSIMADTWTSKKYYHFIRLMGRSASHIALQCALLTKPNMTFIGQQVQAKKMKLKDLVDGIINMIIKRAESNKNYGVVLVPQGLIQFIPEMGALIKEINNLMPQIKATAAEQIKAKVLQGLTVEAKELFNFLPQEIASQLLLDRDPHGNVQVAKIQTQKLLITLVEQQLPKRQKFKGKFSPLANYFGYQGRCAFPTPFDCDYCYSLGLNAAAIIQAGQTGLMSCVRNLYKQPEQWQAGGYPLVTMMNIQTRKGKSVPVIKKALTQLDGPLFKMYDSQRQNWMLGDYYSIVGPVQYEFPNPTPLLAIQDRFKIEDIYWKNNLNVKDYGKNKPFAPMNNYNLNQLTATLAKQPHQYPPILDNKDINLVASLPLEYESQQLQLHVHQQYPFIFKSGNRMVTFKEPHVGQSPKKNLNQKVRIGICFNGRQFPGGHNIISGLINDNVQLIGFIGGTKGLYKQQFIQINQDVLEFFNCQSGFYLLGRSSDSMRSTQQIQKARATCQNLKLNGLVIVGASHSLTDATYLTNYFMKSGCKTNVIAIAASIDNTVYHPYLQSSIGFATSSHMYSTLISNLMIDASSNTKYWYFIKLMGRDPSHLTLQCALQTHPNYTIISQEVQHKGWDLQQIVQDIVRVINKRQSKGLGFGCILIPQGLPNFLPTFQRLKTQLDEIGEIEQAKFYPKMSNWAQQRYNKLPDFIKLQLQKRDQGTKQLAYSQIQTEKLFAYLVENRIAQMKKQKTFTGSFSPVCHFFGYQGRSAIPNMLDRNLAFTYAKIAKILIENGYSGFCPSARGLTQDAKSWFPLAIPLNHMLTMKQKSTYGLNRAIVKSHNVSLKSEAFIQFVKKRSQYELFDHYQSPGPIQHFGKMKTCIPLTIQLQMSYNVTVVDEIQNNLRQLKQRCRFGGNVHEMQIIKSHLQNLMNTLKLMKKI